MDNPTNLRYVASHEWVLKNADGSCTIGITDHAQESLGELVYVELPDVGDTLSQGNPCAVVESTKAASDIYSPIDGEVLSVNELLADEPQTLNDSAFDKGWLFTIKPADDSQIDALLSAEDYTAGLD